MKFLVKEIKNEICELYKKLANRGVVTFLDAYRMTAANWVLQISIVTFVIGLVSVPYNACCWAYSNIIKN